MTEYTINDQKIILTEFGLDVNIGIHDFEQNCPQKILFTIELTVNHTTSTDKIENTLDYDFLRDDIRELTQNRHFNLQETLAQEILDICFCRTQVMAAKVAIAKPDVYPDCTSVGYTVSASRT